MVGRVTAAATVLAARIGILLGKVHLANPGRLPRALALQAARSDLITAVISNYYVT
jgi:hypothetical protein